MHHAPMTCGFCRATFSVSATMFHTGGAVTCPYCHQTNRIGAVYGFAPNHPPPSAPAQSTNTSHAVGIWFAVAFVLFAVPTWKLVMGIVVGLAAGASAITYFAKPKARPLLDRMFMVVGASSVRRFGLALAALAWSGCMLLASVAAWQARADDEQRAERAAAAASEKQAADDAARSERLAAARQKLDAADLEGAGVELVAAEALGMNADTQAIRQALADALHQRDLASLPGVLAGIVAHNAAGAWDAALGDCTRAKAIDGKFAGLAEACSIAEEGQRVAAIPGWIETALAVANDEKRCDSPLDIADAWKNLQRIGPDDAEIAKARAAAAKLEKCRKKSERTFSKGLRDIMIHQREQWAEAYELGLLNEGLDVDVTLSGKFRTNVKIRWVLLSRASVQQIVADGTFLANLETIGFEKVVFSDGYYESWTYTLEPQSEEHGGTAVLEGFGLHEPLRL